MTRNTLRYNKKYMETRIVREWGCMWEYPICRVYADARLLEFAGGSVEAMKTIIASAMFKGGRLANAATVTTDGWMDRIETAASIGLRVDQTGGRALRVPRASRRGDARAPASSPVGFSGSRGQHDLTVSLLECVAKETP